MKDWMARGNYYGYHLQNLTDIHLDPSIVQEFKEAGDPKYLKTIGSLAILIIIIAAINFMNLSTAQASRRTKEVGIKKVSGSTRGMLILQFLSESVILSFISLIFALIYIKVSLPYFNNLLGTSLALKHFPVWYTLLFLILFTLAVGLLAGSYPALFLSSFSPYEVLKGGVKNSMKNGWLRKVLVVFQFGVSILLIIGTILIYRQINYMLTKDPGFDRKQIVVINNAETLGTGIDSFKEAVKGIPGVISISGSSAVPGHNNNNRGYKMEGRKDEYVHIETNFIDFDYLDTYGFTLLSGRTFNKSYSGDKNICLVNESTIRDFGITDTEKTRFMFRGNQDMVNYLEVKGVVKDFHFRSLHNKIEPYMFRLGNDDFPARYLSVKLLAGNYQEAISAIEKNWEEFTGKKSLEYYFMDDDFEKMYRTEKRNGQIAMIFSILALFIASLGLFGLTSFTIEQRTNEIGVRKAMGASITAIYIEISIEILILVSISALIAWPVIYYYSGRWLQNFYYKINPGMFTFIAGLIIALIIAILTISYRVMSAARVNPAQSLKYE
jgi:putative ABC transport system permease protein